MMKEAAGFSPMKPEGAGFSPMKQVKPEGAAAGAIPGMKQMAPAPQQAPQQPQRPQTTQEENPLVNDFSKALNAFTAATQKYQQQPQDMSATQQVADAQQMQPPAAPAPQPGAQTDGIKPAPLPKMASGRYEPGAGWIPDAPQTAGNSKKNDILSKILAGAFAVGVVAPVTGTIGGVTGGLRALKNKKTRNLKGVAKGMAREGFGGVTGGLGFGAGVTTDLFIPDTGVNPIDRAPEGIGYLGGDVGGTLLFDWLDKKRIERKLRKQNFA